MSVDIVLNEKLLDLSPRHVGLGLVVNGIDLDRTAVYAAALVDAVDGHLQADKRGLAAERSRARKRLF